MARGCGPVGKACRYWLIRGAFIAFAILIVVIAFYFSLQYFIEDRVSSSEGTTFYPNDTRLLTHLHPVCQGMTLSIGKDKYAYVASIYILKSAPSLTMQPSFNFTTQPNSAEGYVDYKFHFYPGTDLNVSACYFLDSSNPVTFYMLEGDSELKELLQSKSSKSKNKFEITEDCGYGSNGSSNRFMVVNEAIYHLVFYSESGSLDGINASFTIGQVQYSINRDNVEDSCSVNTAGEPCSVDVPFKAGATLLTFTLAATDWMPYDDKLKFSCSPRVWMVLVISLGSTLVIILAILLMAGLMYVCISCKRRPDSDLLLGDKTPLMRESQQKRSDGSPN